MSMLLVAICIVVYNQGEKDRRESQIKVANNLIRIRTVLLTMLDMDPSGIDEGRHLWKVFLQIRSQCCHTLGVIAIRDQVGHQVAGMGGLPNDEVP